jgi:hypothetical protein
MRQHFSEKQIIELTAFCGMWNSKRPVRPDKRIESEGK